MKKIKKLIKKILGVNTIYYLKDLLSRSANKPIVKKRLSFYSQLVHQGDLYFDVGANYGNRIEIMLKLGCRILAIEPQEQCYKFLKTKYGSKIKIVRKGLGEKEEQKEIFISDAHTVSSFSKDWIDAVKKSGRFKDQEWNRKELVGMTTLDKLIEEYGQPRFIKIDVEGYELEVLKGLNTPIGCISIEYTVPEQTDKAIDCIDYIKKISKDRIVECNYSVNETMEWAMEAWKSCDDMIEYIQTQAFIQTGFGDIYLRLKS